MEGGCLGLGPGAREGVTGNRDKGVEETQVRWAHSGSFWTVVLASWVHPYAASYPSTHLERGGFMCGDYTS